jgi:hypothetical protein
MFILKIYKHGLFVHNGREVRTPCSIKIQRLNMEDIEVIESRLRGAGFKQKDYDLQVDGGLINDINFKNNPLIKEEQEPINSNRDEVLDQLQDLRDKIDSLPSVIEMESMERFLKLILNKIDNIPATTIVEKGKVKKEIDDEPTFIPSINIEGMEIKSKSSTSKRSRSSNEAESAAEILSSMTKKKGES